MADIRYFDYTQFKRHRMRLWSLQGKTPLVWMGGLDLSAAVAALVFGLFSGFLLGFLVSFFNLPGVFVGLVCTMVVGVVVYRTFTRENVKDTPATIFKKVFMRRFQPKKYAQAIGADFAADAMQWQVILWRPTWANVRIGEPRQWITYDPAPISEQVREDIDVTGAGAIADWNRHFYFDEEPEPEPTFTSSPQN